MSSAVPRRWNLQSQSHQQAPSPVHGVSSNDNSMHTFAVDNDLSSVRKLSLCKFDCTSFVLPCIGQLVAMDDLHDHILTELAEFIMYIECCVAKYYL